MGKVGKKKLRGSREKVLTAAARLFSDKGYDAASMREVAESARVTKPTIYYYFKSKEGLFDALLERGVSSLCESLTEINARPASADAKECLVDSVFAGFEFAREHSDLNRFIHGLIFSPMKRRERRAIESSFATVIEQFIGIYRRAAGAGLLEESRISEAVVAVRGCAMAYIIQFLQGKTELNRNLAARIVEGCLAGYGKDSRRPADGAGESCKRESK